MKKLFIIIVLSSVFCISAYSQPDTLWTKTLGGIWDDYGYSVQQTSDGGFIISGSSSSFSTGFDASLIKTDIYGNEIWWKFFGGNANEYGECVRQTDDGGYIIVGATHSFGSGSSDIYLIKTDDLGDSIWTRTFGGGSPDYGFSVQQTDDGGYIIAGLTQSYGAGYDDAYLIKTDTDGNELWSNTYGGDMPDWARNVQKTSDGGYIITGITLSLGFGDVYLVKTDSIGNELWSQAFGGLLTVDEGYSVKETNDGGYIITGYTEDNDNVYLIKTDENGNEVWSQTFGGSGHDYGYCVQQTIDGGFIIAGYTESYGAGGGDAYLIKTDNIGNESWFQTFGGTNSDVAYNIQRTTDRGYIIAGSTGSFGAGGWDVYLIRLDSEGSVVEGFGGNQPMSFALNPPHPNPFNQRVALDFALPSAAPVKLTVYDITGREISILVEGEMSPGYHEITWDAEGISSGIYFVVLNAGEYTQTQKMVLMK